MSSARESIDNTLMRGRLWFAALEARERVMVVACAVAVISAVLFLGVWEPLSKAQRENRAALERGQRIEERIEHAAILVGSSRGSTAPRASTSLLAAVDQSSQQGPMKKAPTRIQPQGEDEVRVWFEDVSFAASVRWINSLQSQYGIQVKTLDIEPESAPGRVKLRASLERPS